METLAPLPIYPSTQARKCFSASQLAQFHSNLSNALTQIIALPSSKRDTPPTRAFVSSYFGDAAQLALESLIWDDSQPVKHDDRLRQHVLLLAEKLASSPSRLELRTLLDLCVACPRKTFRLRSILSAALDGNSDLVATFASEAVPAFTSLLSRARSLGLYGLRKTARCLTSLLRPSPPDLVRSFAHSKEFLVSLAHAYDDDLTAIARSYGGIQIGTADREIDQSEQIWLDTKVDLVDAFHLIVTTIIQDISSASGAQLAVEADRMFGIVFALLDLTRQSATVDAVPFLNRSLVADYQYAYDLSRTLSSVLCHMSRDDARIELLESTLSSLDTGRTSGGAKDPGALKLILRSSGIANKAVPIVQPVSTDKGKGKAKATAPESSPAHDADLDLKVTQVLDILPDHSPEYVRKLLTHPSYPFCGNAERVIEALLEGTAPGEDLLGDSVSQNIQITVPTGVASIERRNIFDQEVMDLDRVHIGKKTLDGASLARDRAEIERMKAEILRFSETMSEDSDEESGQLKALDVIDLDDDLDGAGTGTVKIVGDGEDSGDEEVDPIRPETILELAYIRDPKLFDRDAETRRSKKRADLKQQTGRTDEQIEGWRIMLERNPRKERILQKHEFSGNRSVNMPITRGTGERGGESQGGSSRGRGRGRGRRRGQDGGGSGRPGEKKDDVACERACKERHKSTDRKRGHDKKMGKGGIGRG